MDDTGDVQTEAEPETGPEAPQPDPITPDGHPSVNGPEDAPQPAPDGHPSVNGPEEAPAPDVPVEPTAEGVSAPAPALLVWQALIPQDVPDSVEAQAVEHEWQLEHNPSYQDQFAPANNRKKKK